MKKKSSPKKPAKKAIRKSPKSAARTSSATGNSSAFNLTGDSKLEIGTLEEKRPEEVSVTELHLDPHNPRLADFDHTGTQASILRVLEKEFDLQPLVDSIYRSGFFWEEPLVVVREPLAELKGKEVLQVIEGNRRLAALKTILNNPDLYPNQAMRKRLESIPVIERDSRSETLAFVGFRHITGVLQWEAAAKAQYAHGLVKGGHTLDEISQLIGDKTRDIKRWVRTQSLIEHALEMGLQQEDAERKFYFSYLLTCSDAPATKKWLEMDLDASSGLVTSVDEPKLKRLWFWLYGSKSGEASPVVPESRQIHKLNRVIANPRAVKELERTNNLDRALVETKNPAEYVVDTLGKVRSLLQDLSGIMAGQENLETIAGDMYLVDEAKSEFARVEKILSEAKKNLGF